MENLTPRGLVFRKEALVKKGVRGMLRQKGNEGVNISYEVTHHTSKGGVRK